MKRYLLGTWFFLTRRPSLIAFAWRCFRYYAKDAWTQLRIAVRTCYAADAWVRCGKCGRMFNHFHEDNERGSDGDACGRCAAAGGVGEKA